MNTPLSLIVDKRLYGIEAKVGIDGSSIEAKDRKESPGISLSSVTDIATLGIANYWNITGYVFDGLLQDNQPFGAQSFIESQVGLIGTDQVAGGLDDGFVELEDFYLGHKLGVGVQSDAKPAFVFSTGVEQFIGEFHFRNQDSIRTLATFYYIGRTLCSSFLYSWQRLQYRHARFDC